MRSVMLAVLLSFTFTAGVALAADAPKPKAKPKSANTSEMSPEKRRDLERRIEELERKYEMQYRETDTGAGSPGARPAADTKPATH